MILRPARYKDSALFYRLRNLPEVRAVSGFLEEIEPDEHHWWWYMVPEYRYVIHDHTVPNHPGWGYIRVTQEGVISIAVDPDFRGKGLATEALKEILNVVNIRPLTAVIQYDNLGSQIAFGRAGWRPTRFEVR